MCVCESERGRAHTHEEERGGVCVSACLWYVCARVMEIDREREREKERESARASEGERERERE